MTTLSKKLTDIITSINDASEQIKKPDVQSDAQQLIYYATIISNGEKKLKSQYLRKTAQRDALNHELDTMKTIAEKFNYNLERNDINDQ